MVELSKLNGTFLRIVGSIESLGGRDGSQTHEPRKKTSYVPLNPGYLIGFLSMANYNPHING